MFVYLLINHRLYGRLPCSLMAPWSISTRQLYGPMWPPLRLPRAHAPPLRHKHASCASFSSCIHSATWYSQYWTLFPPTSFARFRDSALHRRTPGCPKGCWFVTACEVCPSGAFAGVAHGVASNRRATTHLQDTPTSRCFAGPVVVVTAYPHSYRVSAAVD